MEGGLQIVEDFKPCIPDGQTVEIMTAPSGLWQFMQITVPPDEPTQRAAFGLTAAPLGAQVVSNEEMDHKVLELVDLSIHRHGYVLMLTHLLGGDAQRAMHFMQQVRLHASPVCFFELIG